MAPAVATASAKAIQQNRLRPKSIVPVIPLPYIQKRQQQDAARAKANEEAAVPSPAVEASRSPTPSANEISPPIANGTSDGQVSEKADEAPEPVDPSEATARSTPQQQEEHHAVTELIFEVKETQETPKSAPSEGESPASRSTYHMPPAFVPATQSQTDGANAASHNNSFDGHHQGRHTHPSAGNVMFGGFSESARSSPAPAPFNPLRYSMVPAVEDGYRAQYRPNGGHTHNTSSGYPTNGTPTAPPEFYPPHDSFGPDADGHSRRPGPWNPQDNFSPLANPMGDQQSTNQGPSTPHSFHGSQSSVANDQGGGPALYGQYPTAIISNGSNGHIEDVRLMHFSRQKPAMNAYGDLYPYLSNTMQSGPPPDQVETFFYLQNQFGRSEYADYTIELRYADDRAQPLLIPGHSILFAQSKKLSDLMAASVREAGQDRQAIRPLLIESDDRFVRSDAFWLAAHRLYGAPLLEHGPHGIRSQSPFNLPTDNFEFALGYAAAGNILLLNGVRDRGIHVAAQYLTWDHVEMAFDFALEGGLTRGWTAGPSPPFAEQIYSTYGPDADKLILHTLQFIISNFPSSFVLDTTVGESAHHRRLPATPQAGPNSRLSSIKFGDHPSEDYTRAASDDPINATLSRVLINLPYDLLKFILESPNLGHVQGWATTSLRQNVMNAVVGEREKRRIKALESPHISNEERKTNGKEWEVVGWMEKVEYVSKISGKDFAPTITKSWVDFTLLDQD
ncbi:hypothetical protein BUE80_DR011933 [Diplocarpon rosae]|nr:hypothetical protein BUE80_DR011933 [Diplocarpon rosae]